jgi:hypothetical protein
MFGNMTLPSLPVTALEYSKRLAFVEQAVAPPSHFNKSVLCSLSVYFLQVYICLVWLRPSLLWEVTQCRLVASYRRFGTTYLSQQVLFGSHNKHKNFSLTLNDETSRRGKSGSLDARKNFQVSFRQTASLRF